MPFGRYVFQYMNVVASSIRARSLCRTQCERNLLCLGREVSSKAQVESGGTSLYLDSRNKPLDAGSVNALSCFQKLAWYPVSLRLYMEGAITRVVRMRSVEREPLQNLTLEKSWFPWDCNNSKQTCGGWGKKQCARLWRIQLHRNNRIHPGGCLGAWRVVSHRRVPFSSPSEVIYEEHNIPKPLLPEVHTFCRGLELIPKVPPMYLCAIRVWRMQFTTYSGFQKIDRIARQLWS